MGVSSLGMVKMGYGKNCFSSLICLILITFCVFGFTDAEDSLSKQAAMKAFNSFCEFNPADNHEMYKLLSPEEKLVNKSAGHILEMFCGDGMLRKVSTASESSFVVRCVPFIEVNGTGWQTLKYYWDLSILYDKCGPAPVCTSMSSTYDSPLLNSSSDELLYEQPITIAFAENRTKETMVGFYPVDTFHYFTYDEENGEGPCYNLTLEATIDEPWVTCTAPSDLAIVPDDTDPTELRNNYFLFNYGLWTAQPPECVTRRCVEIDLEALGFTASDVITPAYDYYLVGEEVEISCAEGQTQLNDNVTSEVITCVTDITNGTKWVRPEESMRILPCSVKQCNRPSAQELGLGSVNFIGNNRAVYNLRETVSARCPSGSAQEDPNVEEETLTCSAVTSGVHAGTYQFMRPPSPDMRLKPCIVIGCPVPNITIFSQIWLDFSRNPVPRPVTERDDIGSFGLVTCDDLNMTYVTRCTRPESGSPIGIWVPTPHCESKTCRNFMGDSNLYEYELQYGRHIIGKPRPIPYFDNLTFVCPTGSIAYMRNELTYQCRVAPNGFGHFEPLEPDVKSDCRPMRCPRNDTRSGYQLDITYPHFEKECFANGTCKKGMIVTLACGEAENKYRHYYQCDMPADAPKVAMNETELEEAFTMGVWFPTPTCDRGCGPPLNVSPSIDCVPKVRKYSQGNWSFPDGFTVNCTCKRGFLREDDSSPQVMCDAANMEWKVTEPCRVDCGPMPDLPNTKQNVTYFETYALMELECEEGHRFFPYRYKDFGPAVVECQLLTGWLNLHLFECKAFDGCTETALHEVYPEIYLTPYKDYYDDGEIAFAKCARGYLSGDYIFEVVVCKAIWEEQPIIVPEEDMIVLEDGSKVSWQPIATDRSPAANISDFHYLPNITMVLTGFEWDYQYLKGNMSCITDYSVHYPEWVLVEKEPED